ncbi:transmembrane secretion effector [Geodermatophilus normandii]|uniref:Transmembrane secretion effector n=1 Tax=Geodermatophilus normandii TaxID=1137989 RepID=A0A317QIP7_9ACTN|nr:MFS transporter [Geodermatophilus normandii]PWW21480.1 transmembrane secretion effector [Geodermatophilus normandii]
MRKDPAAPHTSQARRGPLQRGRPGGQLPLDPVEPGEVAEPAPVPRRRSPSPRGWAIDTSPLRDPGYRRLFWGLTATMVGQQMTLVAVPYQVYALTGDSLLVGVTSIVSLVPLVVFGLLGGAIADAMDRRRLMLVTGVGSAVTSALLAAQALLPGGGNLWLLWLLVAAVSGLTAVNQPARSAVIPALVGAEGWPRPTPWR